MHITHHNYNGLCFNTIPGIFTKIHTEKAVAISQGEVKVTVGASFSEVFRDKTQVLFGAGGFTHNIMKAGRQCNDCHGSPMVAPCKTALRPGGLRVA